MAILREIADATGRVMQTWEKGARDSEAVFPMSIFTCEDPRDVPVSGTGQRLFILPTTDLFCSWTMDKFGITAAEGIRFASRWRSTAIDIAASTPANGIALFRPDPRDAHPVATCAQLLDLTADDASLEDYESRFLRSLAPDTWDSDAAVLAVGGAHMQAIDAYDPGLIGAPLRLVWPRTMFNAGDAPQEICPATVDLTGRSRILLFGPYFSIPSGFWRVSAFFVADQNAEGAAIRLEMNFDGQIIASDIESVAAGAFAATFSFQLDSAGVADFRVWSLRPRLSGALNFAGLCLERLGTDENSSREAGPLPDVFFDSGRRLDRAERKRRG